MGEHGRGLMGGGRSDRERSQVPLTQGNRLGHEGGDGEGEGSGAPPDYYQSTGMRREEGAPHESMRMNEQQQQQIGGMGRSGGSRGGMGNGGGKSSSWTSKAVGVLRSAVAYGLVWILAWILWLAAAGSVTAGLTGGFRCRCVT